MIVDGAGITMHAPKARSEPGRRSEVVRPENPAAHGKVQFAQSLRELLDQSGQPSLKTMAASPA
jgi:hypothetical protein